MICGQVFWNLHFTLTNCVSLGGRGRAGRQTNRCYKFLVWYQARYAGHSWYAAYTPTMASLPPFIPIAKGSCKIFWYFPVLAWCWLSQHHSNIWMFLGFQIHIFCWRGGGLLASCVGWWGLLANEISIKWPVQTPSDAINLLCGTAPGQRCVGGAPLATWDFYI